MGFRPIRFGTLKRNLVLGSTLLIPFMWNACSKVAFDADQSSNKPANICGTPGADPATCSPPPPPPPPGLRAVAQDIEVKVNKDVDILFVVDNSGSMEQEQKDIGLKIGGFLDKIKDLNWQIAITTTDENAMTKSGSDVLRAWGDGQLRSFDGEMGANFILKPNSLPLVADVEKMLGDALNVGIKGSGNERGINAAYRAIERSAAASVNKDFIRADARLAVVVISDEDECSTGLAECKGGTEDFSKPENLLKKAADTLGANKVVSFNSIIYIPNDAACTTGQSEGKVYEQLTNLTGGVKGSVCSNDFSAPLAALGQKVTELVKSVTLSCVPEDKNSDGSPDLIVKLANGSVLTSGFTISGTSVTFASPLPAGVHKFDYFCK